MTTRSPTRADPATVGRRSSGHTSGTPDREAVLERRLLLGGMAVAVLGFWLPAMGWGYLTDEHLTAWITQDGLGDTIQRAQEHQGNSPLYFVVIWCVRQLFGGSALALRLPSVIAALAAAWHLARLGEELDRRETGLIAAFVMVASGGVLVRAINARPYGFLLLALVLSARGLIRYAQTRQWRYGAAWVGFGVLSLYLSPFAAVVVVAHLPFVYAMVRAGTFASREIGRLVAAGGVALLPLTPQVLDLLGRSESLVISEQPSIETLVGYILPTMAIAAGLAGFVVAGGATRLPHDDPRFRFVVAWMVIPIALLFLMGVIGNPVVSVDRYRLGALPGAALAAGMLLARLRLPSGRLVAVATLVLLALLQLPSHVGAPLGWREATEWVTTQTRGEDAIIAFDFSLVEEFDVDDVANPSFTPYFTAPALVYGVTQPVLPLPLGEGPEVDAYLNRVFSELTTHETIALVTNFRIPPPDYRAVFRERLVDLGYVETVGPTGRFVAAAIYRR